MTNEEIQEWIQIISRSNRLVRSISGHFPRYDLHSRLSGIHYRKDLSSDLYNKHEVILRCIRSASFAYGNAINSSDSTYWQDENYKFGFEYSFFNVIEYVGRTIGLHVGNDKLLIRLIEDIVNDGYWKREYDKVFSGNYVLKNNFGGEYIYSAREKEIFKEIMEGRCIEVLGRMKEEKMIERMLR